MFHRVVICLIGPICHILVFGGSPLFGQGQYDVMIKAGDQALDNNNFSLSPGDSFEIIDVNGTHNGFFQGLTEGAKVGEFGNQALFITYSGGDGNDVTLYSQTIPEPSSLLFLGLLTALCVGRRRSV